MRILRALTATTAALLFPAWAADSADIWGRTDPNKGLFPDSSIISFRHLLDAPAGKHGFLQVRNGKFAWPTGKRARFWGVNISNRSVWVDKATVDRVVGVLSRAGCNMVRFEALDSVGGLLDVRGSNSSRQIDPGKLAILDYWIARLKSHGIYYYLNLLDFRQFKEGDEVPAFDQIGRAAKPYAFFDRRLIDLQKEFAQQLLTHNNPITGLRYADDPALALVEICNEHGLFMKAGMLEELVEPYGLGFRQRWNQWLLKRHGTRDGIKAAWGKLQGEPVLADSEDPNAQSVRLPLFSAIPAYLRQDTSVIDVRRAQTRLRDGARFLYDTQRAYFREMRGFLRSIGVRVPITGVVSNDIIPDVASAAHELDFTSENYYGDHPAFAGADWQGKFFYNDTNPLRMSSVYQFAPWIAALRWENKPVVVRELATVWPNRYRAVGIPEAAAYASLHDFDAVLLFGYQVVNRPERLSDFAHQSDPPVWGLFGLAAQAYFRGDVAPSAQTFTLDYTPDSLFKWPNQIGERHRASWIARLNSRLVSAPGPKSAAAPLKLNPAALVSSTRQIERRTREGFLKIVTPRTVTVAGELPVNMAIALGPFTLSTPTPIGAFMVVSLDGKPLSTSRRFIAKMVSTAVNTGQELAPSPPGAPARRLLAKWGSAPVLTKGRPSAKPTIVGRGGRSILSIGLVNGTWEMVYRDGKATLMCDSPGIRATVLGRSVLADFSRSLRVGSLLSKAP